MTEKDHPGEGERNKGSHSGKMFSEENDWSKTINAAEKSKDKNRVTSFGFKIKTVVSDFDKNSFIKVVGSKFRF